eukprot:TRINITY_DN25672_c0_g1_i1.p1 TRINITY_DN25672_c0_g1~~TRINITY_DN25672_c0_g1_i1.p1  ORF type:complete len:366 (+),score=73.87 TRINITY_DN25672_c0_g1_i1:41-1099(+)
MSDASFLAHVTLVDFGVLGTQLTPDKGVVQTAPEPSDDTAIVDPAGLPFIQTHGPSKARGASGAIYEWLGIKADKAFPDAVREAIKAPCQARYHLYGQHRVIHVVGPNLHAAKGVGEKVVAQAITLLAKAYASVLSEFLRSGASYLRLLPISGGIFAGRFADDIPWMTFAALDEGFASLPADAQSDLKSRFASDNKVQICIFGAGAFAEFAAGLEAKGAPPEGGAKFLSALWPGSVALISGLESEKAQQFNGTNCTVLSTESGGKYLVEMAGGAKATLPLASLTLAEGGALVPGVTVILQDLQAEKARKYIGTEAVVKGWNKENHKWMVKLCDGITAGAFEVASLSEPLKLT